ncbi:MAG: HAMP domain-containing histidine kinase [Candidatus Kapabacteria bacterium]|nr:HAMP domain-containing histidine kinase [Candidatus Kapabacteria bacterium]
MKIRLFTKMIFLTGSIFVLMAVVIAFSWYSFYLNNKNESHAKLDVLILESSQLRLEMLIRRDSAFANLYSTNREKLRSNFHTIDSLMAILQKDARIRDLAQIKLTYANMVNEYIQLIAEMGLNENDGVEGKLRRAVHDIERKLDETNLDRAQVYLLQVRRREKDYIMRHRFEYVQKVSEEMTKVIDAVNQSKINDTTREEIELLAANYLASFSSFVDISIAMNSLEQEMNLVEIQFKKLIRKIVVEESANIADLQSLLIYLFALTLIISIVLALIVSRSIANPVAHLQESVMKVSEGDLTTRAAIESSDEIGELAKFFNEMVKNLSEKNETILEQQKKLNRQYDELKEMNITKDKFFSIIAHDLKNPISSFLSVSDFLVGRFNDLTKDEIREFLDEVHISAKNVYELLENLLLWSRSQRGLLQYNPMVLDLKTLIVNNIDLLRINAEAKEIQLTCKIHNQYQVYSDPNMLNTILRNLITNATKFTSEGGKINVLATDYDDNPEFCCIMVADTGIGISEQDMKKLFNLENSFSTNGTKDEKGTGLGLILCRDFVSLHKGKIWVESQLGKGSTFYFTIPLAKINEEYNEF